MAKQRFQIMIEPKQHERLRELSRLTGATVAEIIRRAIDAYLKQPEVELQLKYREQQEPL